MRDITTLDISELMSDETLDEIFERDEDDTAPADSDIAKRSLPYINRAKELKQTKTFSDWLKLAIKDYKHHELQQRASSVQTCAVHPQDFYIGDELYTFNLPGYEYQKGIGLFRVNNAENNNMIRVCHRVLFPVQVFSNLEDMSERVKIMFEDSTGKWRPIIESREKLTKASDIQKLSRYGMDVNSENAKEIVKFLVEVENLNQEQMTRGVSTSKLGWKDINGERVFVPYTDKVSFDAAERFKGIFDSLTPNGEREAWYSLVREVRGKGRKEPNVYLIASFASVLLKSVNCLPFIVNLWTRTGRGKTVALMLACSVWASPEEGQYLTDPTSTRTALEQRMGTLNNLPMMIDDLSKMREQDEQGFAKMIYFLCAGKGKERSNIDLAVVNGTTWCNCILTNMERPLCSAEMQGGAINRVIDFKSDEGYYFEENGQDRGNYVVNVIKQNYGFAGREWIELLKNYSDSDLKERFKAWQARIKEIAGEDVKEEKQIAPMALILMTDELVESEIFKDGVRLDAEWCVEQLKSINEVDENERAYENLMGLIAMNTSQHFDVVDKQEKITRAMNERWGFILEAENMVYLFKPAIESIANKMNFSIVALMEWAELKGYTKVTKDHKRKQIRKRDPITKNPAWVYCMKMLEDTEFIEVSEDESLPFD